MSREREGALIELDQEIEIGWCSSVASARDADRSERRADRGALRLDSASLATGNWTAIPPVTISFGPTRGAHVAMATAEPSSLAGAR